MSDRSDMSLTLGGPIDADILVELSEVLADREFSTDWEEKALTDPEEFEKAIRACAIQHEHLFLCVREQVGGMDEDLEIALQEMGVSYARHGASHYAYSASIAFWQPDMESPREWTSDNEGIPYLAAPEIRRLLGYSTLQDELALMETATNLSPIEIVEGE